MKKQTRIVTIAIVIIAMTAFTAVAAAADFTDSASIEATYVDAVSILQERGVFTGTVFNPQSHLTRKEVAVLLCRLMEVDLEKETINAGKLADIPCEAWYRKEVEFMVSSGTMSVDSKGNFNPDEELSGYQLTAICLKANAIADCSGSQWIFQVARIGNELKLFSNLDSVVMSKPVTREVAAQLLANLAAVSNFTEE